MSEKRPSSVVGRKFHETTMKSLELDARALQNDIANKNARIQLLEQDMKRMQERMLELEKRRLELENRLYEADALATRRYRTLRAIREMVEVGS